MNMQHNYIKQKNTKQSVNYSNRIIEGVVHCYEYNIHITVLQIETKHLAFIPHVTVVGLVYTNYATSCYVRCRIDCSIPSGLWCIFLRAFVRLVSLQIPSKRINILLRNGLLLLRWWSFPFGGCVVVRRLHVVAFGVFPFLTIRTILKPMPCVAPFRRRLRLLLVLVRVLVTTTRTLILRGGLSVCIVVTRNVPQFFFFRWS